jgi:hypothetical protein
MDTLVKALNTGLSAEKHILMTDIVPTALWREAVKARTGTDPAVAVAWRAGYVLKPV